MTFWEVDILGVDTLGVDILGVDILRLTQCFQKEGNEAIPKVHGSSRFIQIVTPWGNVTNKTHIESFS